MKVPAIRAQIGDWTYYVSTLTFNQVNEYVSRVDEELHKSESLKDLIQRSITNNYKSIQEYIINQPELFFNSLVLAVYDDYPDWSAIEVKYDDFETHQIGILEFPGQHKIFPLDGQHRVEGIKAALETNPEFGDQTISAIFVGHKNDEAGMRRSRRLFSTLNRYAKPVTMDDIIALDEDDSVAIVTRNLLEEYGLFMNKRVTKSENKAIPDSDKSSITSIITLYQCNKELLKLFRKKQNQITGRPKDNRSLAEYLKFRPQEEKIENYQQLVVEFWNCISGNIEAISTFSSSTSERPAEEYRKRDTGGHLIFRPIGILPFVQAVIEIHNRKGHSFDDILLRLKDVDFSINAVPWRFVVWNPTDKTMIMNGSAVVKLLLFYMYGNSTIKDGELATLKGKYAAKLGIEEDAIDGVLNSVPLLS